MENINIFWFRRDLRLNDNAGLYHALKNSEYPTLCIFIFDKTILSKLPPKDLRVNFIYQSLNKIKAELNKLGSDLLVLHDTPQDAWTKLLSSYIVKNVYTNQDYEPSARKRDSQIAKMLSEHKICFNAYKDQVIYEPGELLTGEGKPYTVYTPFSKKWKQNLTEFL